MALFLQLQPKRITVNINQSLQYILKLFLLTIILNGLDINIVAAQVQQFGQAGRDGVDGRPGQNGISGSDQKIRASQQLQKVDLSGTDGEAGESATSGEQASECQQPKKAANVWGVKGGNGGNGGNGGDGGNGGNITLYFKSLSQLKNVVLRNRGGRAGFGGNGGQSAAGCNCTQPQWTLNYCTWALMVQQMNVANAPWKETQRKLFSCSGDAYYDQQQNRPQSPNSYANYRYGWKYIGLLQQKTFSCQNGQSGEQGRKGANGQRGRYGHVWLVQGNDIPKEQISYSDRISLLVDKTIPLLKNNWLQKTGLRNLLGNGSDVQSTYNLLQTVQGAFKVVWQAAKRPQELGNPEIRSVITELGELQFDIPGTLEYKLTKQQKQTVVAITGGFHPERLGQFKFQGFDRFRDPRNFTLLDEGKLLPELKAVKLTIILSQNNYKASEVSYPFTSQPPYPQGLSVWGNLYKVNLGDRFDSLLQSGQPIQYKIRVEQTTRSGVTYTSGMEINLIVDKVTPSPDVHYYSPGYI